MNSTKLKQFFGSIYACVIECTYAYIWDCTYTCGVQYNILGKRDICGTDYLGRDGDCEEAIKYCQIEDNVLKDKSIWAEATKSIYRYAMTDI